jgi:hypothetical protein
MPSCLRSAAFDTLEQVRLSSLRILAADRRARWPYAPALSHYWTTGLGTDMLRVAELKTLLLKQNVTTRQGGRRKYMGGRDGDIWHARRSWNSACPPFLEIVH